MNIWNLQIFSVSDVELKPRTQGRKIKCLEELVFISVEAGQNCATNLEQKIHQSNATYPFLFIKVKFLQQMNGFPILPKLVLFNHEQNDENHKLF